MSHIAIYTVITGDYDTVKQPQVVMPEVGYFLFTNNISIVNSCGKIGVWNVIFLDIETERDCEINNILLSRKVKMLPHNYLPNGFDVSIYLDADMLITDDLTELIDNLDDNTSMVAFKHSHCHSVREEIDDLIGRGVVDKDMAESQWQRYVEWGFKDDIGITENGCLIRRHNEKYVVELMELWWQEFKNGCLRDQVSLMPCIHRVKFSGLKMLDGNIHNNKWIRICNHKK